MEKEIRCRCTRCKNEHDFSDRVDVEDKKGITHILACPKCFAHSYHDITEYGFKYCTGYPVIDICPKQSECQLVINLKTDNPSTLDLLRVRHYTKRSLKNCKYFKKTELHDTSI
jgi:hypothetical protein